MPKEAGNPVMDLPATKSQAVDNVYATFRERAKERTAKNKQMVLGSRTKYQGRRRFRVTFASSIKRK